MILDVYSAPTTKRNIGPKLMAEAGHPNGFKTTVEAPAAVYGPDFDDFVQITLKNWKAAGIDADLKLKEYGAFISSTIFGKFDAMFLGLRGAWADPEAYFYRWFMPGQPLNVWGVNDPKLIDMIKLQRRTFDVAKRKQLVWQIEKVLAQEVARPIILHGAAATCWHPHLKGHVLHENSIYNNWRFESVWLDK